MKSKTSFSKIMTSVAIVVTIFVGIFAINKTNALADTKAKAVSVNAKIAVDGAPETQLLVYNVDGNNYYRIADVGRLLDYRVKFLPVDKAMLELYNNEITITTVTMDTKDTIILTPTLNYNATGGTTSDVLPLASSSKTINVIIKDMNLSYDGVGDNVIKCFNVDGYNYFKLVDIKTAVYSVLLFCVSSMYITGCHTSGIKSYYFSSTPVIFRSCF